MSALTSTDLRAHLASVRGRAKPELIHWLTEQAVLLARLEGGAVEIGRARHDVWSFRSAREHVYGRGTAGCDLLVDALTQPGESIALPNNYENTRGQWRRALVALGVAPAPVVDALDHVRLHRRGRTSGFMRFVPPEGCAQFRRVLVLPPREHAMVCRAN